MTCNDRRNASATPKHSTIGVINNRRLIARTNAMPTKTSMGLTFESVTASAKLSKNVAKQIDFFFLSLWNSMRNFALRKNPWNCPTANNTSTVEYTKSTHALTRVYFLPSIRPQHWNSAEKLIIIVFIHNFEEDT